MNDNMKNAIEDLKPKERKKTINQKHKGKRGETWFADKLSEVSQLNFERIYTSGASVGKTNSSKLLKLTQAQSESQLGDINSPEDLKYYYIWEIKNYNEVSLHQLFSKSFSKQINGWLDELEFDLLSAQTKLKDNYRIPIGFLCIKMSRKGEWIIGNFNYLQKKVFLDNPIILNNFLTFNRTFNKDLKFYESTYFMTDFTEFITDNKKILFDIDYSRQQRKTEALQAYERIMSQ